MLQANLPDLYLSGRYYFYYFLLYFIILASNQYSALEGDTISIFQGCLLNKYPLDHSSEQRPLVPLLTRHAEIQKTHGRTVTQHG